jgi:hypothetical protein
VVLAALSFLLVAGATLSFRLLSDRGGSVASALVLADATASTNTIVSDVRPDEQPTQIGVLLVRNASSILLRFRAAGIENVDAGLALVGFAALVPAENDQNLAGQCGPFPPPNFATHPLDGFTLAPAQEVAIVVAVRATRAGSLAFDGVRVFYDASSKQFHQDLPLRVRLESSVSNTPCTFDPTPHQRAGAQNAAV